MTADASAAGTTSKTSSTRVAVQKFGTFLSGMIMPNIAAFIAWGLITALFIEKGPFPIAVIGGFGVDDAGDPNPGLVGPMVRYMLPILIAAQGGRMIYGVRARTSFKQMVQVGPHCRSSRSWSAVTTARR